VECTIHGSVGLVASGVLEDLQQSINHIQLTLATGALVDGRNVIDQHRVMTGLLGHFLKLPFPGSLVEQPAQE
jgi:hypothetical protein